MPPTRRKSCLTGLALGSLSTAFASAADGATFADASGGGGLVTLLLYLPAGMLLAAAGLEILSRAKKSKPMSEGVFGLLGFTAFMSVFALIAMASSASLAESLEGTPFVHPKSALIFSALVVAAWIGKWLSLKTADAQPAAEGGKPKKRGRVRGGRGRKSARGKDGDSTRSGLAGAAQFAYAGLFVAAIAAMITGPLAHEPSSGIAFGDEAEELSKEEKQLASEPIETADVEDPEPIVEPAVTPSPEEPAVIATNDPTENEPIDGDPDPVASGVAVEPDPSTPEESTDPPGITSVADPEPAESVDPEVAMEGTSGEPMNSVPTPPVRPVVTETGGLAGADTYKKLVQPILRSRCYSCHGEEKQKGDLRLDTPEGIRAGGKSGPVIIAGNVDKSYLFELISLPEDDDDIMPPKGKPLSESQISWIGGWIREGAALGDGVAWPQPEGSADTGLAIDALAGDIGAPDAAAIQKLQSGGVIVRNLSTDGRLLEIDFSHADRAAGDLRLAELAPLANNIHTLDLKRTRINDDDLKSLSNMGNLRILHLQRTKLTDAAIPHLTSLSNLESLNLYSTQVSDASIPELKKLSSLKKVYLWSTKITSDGARDLAATLTSTEVNMGE